MKLGRAVLIVAGAAVIAGALTLLFNNGSTNERVRRADVGPQASGANSGLRINPMGHSDRTLLGKRGGRREC